MNWKKKLFTRVSAKTKKFWILPGNFFQFFCKMRLFKRVKLSMSTLKTSWKRVEPQLNFCSTIIQKRQDLCKHRCYLAKPQVLMRFDLMTAICSPVTSRKKHHQICRIHTWKLVHITGQFYRCPSIDNFCGACIYEIDVHPNLIFFFFVDGNIVPIVIVVVRRILIRIIIGKPWKKEQKKGELNWWIEQNSHNCQTINWPTCYRTLASGTNEREFMWLHVSLLIALSKKFEVKNEGTRVFNWF